MSEPDGTHCHGCGEWEHFDGLNRCVHCNKLFCHECSRWCCSEHDEANGDWLCDDCADEEVSDE